ncbi:hypothetical protein J7643_16495 [bacterium]|nr:hypothetical protein [bacterium]
MKTKKQAARRAQIRRRRIFLGLCLAGILSLGVWGIKRALPPARPKPAPAAVERNAQVIRHAAALQQALDAYASSHGGTVPRSAKALKREILESETFPKDTVPIRLLEVVSDTPGETDVGALGYSSLGGKRYRLYGVGHDRAGKPSIIIQLGEPLR